MVATPVPVAYRIVDGARMDQAQARRLGPVIHELATQHVGSEDEGVTPEALVDAARDPNSPAHGDFEWDNAIAGESWRHQQARYYLRSIEVRLVSRTNEEEEAWVRAFQPVQIAVTGTPRQARPEPKHYVPIERVLASDDFLQQVIEQAQRDALVFHRKYRLYLGLPAFQAVLGEAMDALARVAKS